MITCDKNHMAVFIGKEAYNFTVDTVFPDNSIQRISLKDYISGGYKCLLFFYPLNFTFVCPSEIIAFNNRIGQFEEKHTKLLGISVDSVYSHIAWKSTPYNKGGIGSIQIPLVSDLNKEISRAYGVLNSDGVALRGTFIIDHNFILRHMSINDLAIGRNVEESLRTIDMIDHHNEHGDVCPAGWRQGEEGMKPTSQGVSDYLVSHAAGL